MADKTLHSEIQLEQGAVGNYFSGGHDSAWRRAGICFPDRLDWRGRGNVAGSIMVVQFGKREGDLK